MNGDKLTLMI